MKLSGPQYKKLTEVLVEVFDEESLTRMVRFGLEKKLSAIAGGRDLTHLVFKLIEWTQAHGKLEDLILASRNEIPTNPDLRMVAEELQLAATEPSQKELERIVLRSVHFSNVEPWRERMSQCELPVCRVEVPGVTMGTGFLLAPNVVMTNYHIIEDVIANPALRDTVVLRFDYKTDSEGRKLKPGVEYSLTVDDHWLIDNSPAEVLDYALLRIKGTPGNDPIGNQYGAAKRGWLIPQAYTFEQGEPLLIIQHPCGTPLKITVGSINNVVNQIYIRYTANTLDGSSGSPCFNSDWKLVALHHASDALSNEGIVFSTILANLQQKNLLGILGE